MKAYTTSKEHHLFDKLFFDRQLSFSLLTPPCRKFFNFHFYRMKKNKGYGLITAHFIFLGFGIYFSWYIKHK